MTQYTIPWHVLKMVLYSTTTKTTRNLFNHLFFFGKSFQKQKVMLFEYHKLDIVGKTRRWKHATQQAEMASPQDARKVDQGHAHHGVVVLHGAAVRRSSHFLFWSGVHWRFLRHLPHLSAFFLPRVTPWPRSGVVCHAIILRNVCIYMRRGLKSGSGPLTTRSTTWSSQTRLDFFLTFSLRRGVLL